MRIVVMNGDSLCARLFLVSWKLSYLSEARKEIDEYLVKQTAKILRGVVIG